MRALALLLILANLGFLGWAKWVDVRVDPSVAQAGVGGAAPPRLVLAAEAPARPATPGPEAGDPNQPEALGGFDDPAANLTALVPPQADLAPDASCVSVGAFRDLTEAVQASAALQTAGHTSRQRMDQGDIWLGYWVSVQNLATREAAEAALVTLSQAGVTDAYILPGAEPANTLSLGVFTDATRAERRVEEIRALGFDPQLADRRRAGSVYWVDVDLPEPGVMPDPAILQSEPGKIVRLEFRPCPEPSTVSGEAEAAPEDAPPPAEGVPAV